MNMNRRPIRKQNMTIFLKQLLFAVCSLSLCASLAAADYPIKPVHFIVPFPPGGGTDAVARILGTRLAKMWGEQVVVENRAGAQGNIGTALGVKAPPDGYTLIFAHQGVLTINSHLYDKIGFDPVKDLVPVARTTEQPFVVVVNPALPVRSLQDLTELARKEPGRLTFASSSSGPQMAGEMYKMASGADLLHVAYKGAGPALIDVLAGHVDMMFANPSSAAPHVKSGKLRALAVFGRKRIDAMPDVPTAQEAGYPQLGETPEWYGVAVPVGTPAAIVSKLNADIVAALGSPEVDAAIRALGLTPSPSTAEEFARQIRADHAAWGKVVKVSGVKAD
jgi:tripartite-type tricarboxylate transporter receptor subunit TctC